MERSRIKTINNKTMGKIYTITITAKEVEVPNYVVPTSNFGFNNYREGGAYIMGIPCAVVSEPRKNTDKDSFGNEKTRIVVDVVSLMTGIKYTIPLDTEFVQKFDFLGNAIKASKVPEYEEHIFTVNDLLQCHNDETEAQEYAMKHLVGNVYHVNDNSWIKNIADNKKDWVDLTQKDTKLHSLIFTSEVVDENDSACDKEHFTGTVRKFVLVKSGNKVYRTMFQEWGFWYSRKKDTRSPINIDFNFLNL